MIRSDVRNLVLHYLDDPNAGYFTTSLVNTWINLAQSDAQKILIQAGENFYLKIYETTMVVDQSDYIFPSDFLKIHRLEVISSGLGTVDEERRQLRPITLNQQDLVFPGHGTPTHYVIKRSRLSLFPSPDTANTLRLSYSYQVSDLSSDSEVVDVPDRYVDLVAILAAKRGFVKDDRLPTNLVEHERSFKEDLKKDSEDRNEDESRRVITNSIYGVR